MGQEGNALGAASDGTVAVDPSGWSWFGEWWNPSNRLGATGIAFADNRSGPSAAGGGHYALAGAAGDADGRVAAGMAALRYDLAACCGGTTGAARPGLTSGCS